jgi:hypothetical protein
MYLSTDLKHNQTVRQHGKNKRMLVQMLTKVGGKPSQDLDKQV